MKLSGIPDSKGGCEEPAQNEQPSSNQRPSRELPPEPDVDNIYEEPDAYTKLHSSKTASTDGNYQSLIPNSTKHDRSLNENVQESLPLNIERNSANNAPQQIEYVSIS